MQFLAAVLVLVILTSSAVERAGPAARIGQPSPDSEQGFASLLDGRDLEGWESVRLRPKAASVQDGILRLAKGPGWLRTRTSFADFVLRFDSRFRGPRAAFSILIRALDDRHSPGPIPGYGISIDAGSSETQPRAALVVIDNRAQRREFPFTHSLLAERLNQSEQWQTIELSCTGRACKLAVNGGAVASLTNLEVPLGHIGFSVAEAAVEFRNIRIRRTSPIVEGFAQGAYLIDDDSELTPPRVQHETRPRYSADALAAKIQGAVLLACVVKEDGTVGEIALLRSLDSRFGLDQEAVLAARQWRFTPAVLRGQQVRTLVTIELTFSIRR